MKKLVLLGFVVSGLAFASPTQTLTFKDYVKGDLESVTKKVTDPTSPVYKDACYKARYEKMLGYIKSLDNTKLEQLRSTVSSFCNGKTSANAVFERDGKKYNGIALYNGDVTTGVCKGKENDNRGTVWFVDKTECPTLSL